MTHDTLFNKGEVTLVVSRPGNGKNGWTIQKLMECTNKDKSIFAIPLETPKRQFEYMGKKNGQESLDKWDIQNDKKVGIEEIKAKLLNTNKSFDILYIDNIDLLLTPENKVVQKKADYHGMITELASMSEELNIALVLGKGLAKDVDEREDKRPILKDVKLNNPTKNIFSNIIGLYREEIYNQDTEKKNVIEISYLKSEENSEPIEEYYNIRK